MEGQYYDEDGNPIDINAINAGDSQYEDENQDGETGRDPNEDGELLEDGPFAGVPMEERQLNNNLIGSPVDNDYQSPDMRNDINYEDDGDSRGEDYDNYDDLDNLGDNDGMIPEDAMGNEEIEGDDDEL